MNPGPGGPDDCPPWIDPGNAFRLVVSCGSYSAKLVYGDIEMAEQEHELWINCNSGYNLDKFTDDMAALMIWGSCQTIAVWAVDRDSDAKWKLRRNEHFEKMINSRVNDRSAKLVVEVVLKEGYGPNFSSVGSKPTSGVTSEADPLSGGAEAFGDNHSSPSDIELPEVDWDTLIILPDAAQDGETVDLVDEDRIFEAMGFKDHDDNADQQRAAASNPAGSAQIDEEDMRDASIDVNDIALEEPVQEWDRDNPDMSVGAVYPSMDDFRDAIKQHAIVNEFILGTEKSDKVRFRGYCKADGCTWVVRARTQFDNSVRVQIISKEHNCASAGRQGGTMASQSWVAQRAIPLLKKKPAMGAKELQEALQDKYNIEILYQTVWYGRQRAADKLFGKWDDSFDWLYRFKAEVELRSPGSVIEIDTETIDGQVHFSRFFCAFQGSIDGFLNGCRPYISIDSTALNGMWNGHMPAALALDGHNWMFPLALGFFGSETTQNWTWFMEQLGKVIGHVPKLAICTDAGKGLMAAVKAVFPNAEKRECFRHLMENMKKSYTGEVYSKNMWGAARAYTSGKHKYFMDKVLEVSPEVQDWLDKDHPLFWSRSKFSADIKVDYIHNNLAEAWNAWIKEVKDMPVHCMVDAIREKVLILCEKRRRISMALSGQILPAVVHQLNAASRGLGHLKVIKGRDDRAEVTEQEEVRRHVVYLNEHECTCREWQVTGKPCAHALAVITSSRGMKIESFVDRAYSVDKFRAAYAGLIPNITDRSQWPTVDKDFKLLPPPGEKRGPGRLRKNRIPGFLERSGKATRQVTCQGCGEKGHRRGSWRCTLTGTKKRKRKTKAKKPGRKKKAKVTDDVNPPVNDKEASIQASPRTPLTRAAAAREAAAASAKEAAAAAAREATATAAAAASSSTKRILDLEVPFALEVVPALDAELPKKITPRKCIKKLATKVKKTSKKT